MKHFAENIINQAGVPVAGASVTVFVTGTQNQPTIYSDDGITPKANPLITDALGRFDFYVADGRYDLAVTGPTLLPFTLSNIEIADLTEAQTADAIWDTEAIRFVNQGAIPGTPPAGNINIYSKSLDKRLYYKDDTGTEIGPLVPGGTTSPVNSPSPFVFNTDMEFKGPDPYVDIRAFGARASNPNVAPAQVGITANINIGTPTQATISTPSTFVNGDGVVIYGAGTAHGLSTPSAPTVQPAVATIGTGTGFVSTSVPLGSLTTCYQVVAASKGGGLTAASPETCTSVGNPLGAQQVNITSMSRSGQTVTVTTAAPHGFASGGTVNGEVFIGSGNSLSDASFYGWYQVVAVTDSTHFLFNSNPDTRLGATASATGGTAQWFNANHISWNQVPGAVRYYIYAGNSGAETLVGVSNIQGASIDLTWDDFGSTIMGNFSAPPYVPNTPPGSATANNLSTTITGGAGTTTLTLANAASTTVTGATIRLDAGPAWLAAATSINANGGQGTLYIPATGGLSFVINSYTDTSNLNYAVSQNGTLFLNETIQYAPNGSGGANWTGELAPQAHNLGPGGWKPGAIIFVNTANPGIYVSNGFGVTFRGLDLGNNNASNNIRLMLVEGAFNQTYQFMNLSTGSGADFSGIGLYLRASPGGGASNIKLDHVSFNPGQSSNTLFPSWFCGIPGSFGSGCGTVTTDHVYYVHRGAVYSGSPLINVFSYINGGGTPLYTTSSGSAGWVVSMGPVILDTIAAPCVAPIGPQGGTIIFPAGTCTPSSAGPGPSPTVTGTPSLIVNNPVAAANAADSPLAPIRTFAVDGTFNAAAGNLYSAVYNNAAFRNGPAYPMFIAALPMAAPTCSVSAGGSVAVGSYTFKTLQVWQNGGVNDYTSAGLSSTCTATPGNQTITINWAAAPGNPKDYRIYTVGPLGSGYLNVTGLGGQTSYAWTGSVGVNGGSQPGVTAGGPTMLMPGVQGIATPALTLGGYAVTAPTSGTLAVSSGSPASGNLAKYSSPTGSLIDSGVSAGSLATVPLAVGNLAPGSNGQCVNTSGSAAVWGSCAGTAGVQTVFIAPGGSGANAATTNQQTMDTFSPGFSAGALNSLGKTFRVTQTGSWQLLNTSQSIILSLSLQGGVGSQPFVSIPASAMVNLTGGYNICWTCAVTTTGASGILKCGLTGSFIVINGGTTVSNALGNQTNFATSANLTNALSVATVVQFPVTGSSSNTINESWMLVEQLN